MDRFRTLQQNEKKVERQRRASYSGFEPPKLTDPSIQRRRQSLPAQLVKKEDNSRKLHNSAACVNIIEDLKSIKLISKSKGKKGPPQHALDPNLQFKVRSRRNSPATIAPSPLLMAPEGPPQTKKSLSAEGMNRVDQDNFKVRRTSSESLLEGLDVADPEAIEVSDDENYENPEPIGAC